jgi:hypothetical protein
MTTTDPTAEHAQHEKDPVEILVNNRSVTVPKHTTGEEIKRLANVPLDFQLFRIDGNSEHPIENTDKVSVHTGQRFVASPSLDPS